MNFILNKVYEKEINTNKKIGLEIQAMFNSLAELFTSKVLHCDLNLG